MLLGLLDFPTIFPQKLQKNLVKQNEHHQLRTRRCSYQVIRNIWLSKKKYVGSKFSIKSYFHSVKENIEIKTEFCFFYVFYTPQVTLQLSSKPASEENCFPTVYFGQVRILLIAYCLSFTFGCFNFFLYVYIL